MCESRLYQRCIYFLLSVVNSFLIINTMHMVTIGYFVYFSNLQLAVKEYYLFVNSEQKKCMTCFIGLIYSYKGLVLVFGCLLYTSVFLLGLDGQFVSPKMYPTICQARVWLLSLGFTLGYGAMFSKVWRVHRLTTKTKSDTTVSTIYFIL